MPEQHADGASVDRVSVFPFRAACAVALVAVMLLAGCTQPGGSGTSAPSWPADTTPDPYHYRCTGNCQAG